MVKMPGNFGEVEALVKEEMTTKGDGFDWSIHRVIQSRGHDADYTKKHLLSLETASGET